MRNGVYWLPYKTEEPPRTPTVTLNPLEADESPGEEPSAAAGSEDMAETPDLMGSEAAPEVTMEDVLEAKGRPIPREPTERERALHVLTHIPAQPWCDVCTRAKAVERPHRAQHDEREVDEVQMDYCFLRTTESLAGDSEGTLEPLLTILVLKHTNTGAIHAVQGWKGVLPYM
eukprot:1937784-Amphidinium_carterae.1